MYRVMSSFGGPENVATIDYTFVHPGKKSSGDARADSAKRLLDGIEKFDAAKRLLENYGRTKGRCGPEVGR